MGDDPGYESGFLGRICVRTLDTGDVLQGGFQDLVTVQQSVITIPESGCLDDADDTGNDYG